MDTNLKIAAEELGTLRLFELTGELQVHTSPLLRYQLLEALQHPLTGLILDLSRVSYIDSTGVGVLLAMLRRCTDRELHFALVCDNLAILRIFEITGLRSWFPVFPSLDAALLQLEPVVETPCNLCVKPAAPSIGAPTNSVEPPAR